MVSPRKENSWMVDILLKILGVPQPLCHVCDTGHGWGESSRKSFAKEPQKTCAARAPRKYTPPHNMFTAPRKRKLWSRKHRESCAKAIYRLTRSSVFVNTAHMVPVKTETGPRVAAYVEGFKLAWEQNQSNARS